MNRSYQLVWNAALRVVQVASEMARRPGTRGVSAIGSPPRLKLTAVALALATALGLPSPVRADVELPVFGSATGATPTVSIVGNTLTFTQPASSSIRVDWTSFNVGAGGTVSLLQTVAPGTTASHSVSSGTASLIDGSLTMQGRQAFANARGITIGTTSVVGGDDLVLAAMSMSPSANGNPAGYLFDAGGTAASLVNAGTIQGAAYGSMALLGSSVRNEGAITASYNDIQIVAASHVDDGGPTSNYPSNPPVLGGYAPLLHANGGQPAIDNAGTITNPGGSVRLLATASPGLYDTLIRNSGTISTGGGPGDATGTVRLDASGGDIVTSGAIHGGRLVALYADAKVLVSGTIDTSGDDYFGGRVEIGGSLNDPAGMVPKVAYIGDGARIAVGEHVGGIAIKAIDALHLGGVVNAHGVSGSVNLSSSGYLEADAQVDLGYFQGSPGDFTIHSGDAMVVTDAVVSRIDANGVYTPGGPSQVRASMLGAAGGNTWLSSDADIGIDADLTFAANNGIRMYAEATGSVALAQGKSIAFTGRQNGTLALIAAQGITLGAQSSISFNPLAYNMLILQGRTIHTDAAVDASYVTATASQGDITQDYGPIHADKMDADATGDIALLADNRMTTLGMSAGGDATIRNRDSLRIDRADIAGATSLWSMGDIDATAPNNRFVGQVSLQAFDVALSNSVALGVGTVRAHDLSLTSPAGITFYGDTMASYRGWFTTVNQPITQQAGTSLYVNGDATFNAGTADITLDSPRNVFNSRINAIGGNIRLADANGMMIWNVSASGQLWLAPGGPAPSASFYGTVAAHDTHVEGSAYIGYSGAEHALTGDLSTTGFVALSGSVRHTYDGDFSVGTDLYQEGSISALNGHTIVHGLTSTFGGTLLVGDRDHDTAVLTSDVLVGSFLGGTGRIDGDVTAKTGGRIAPGDGIGTLTINGSLTLAYGGGLAIDLGRPGADLRSIGNSDRLHVTGDVSVDSPIIDITDGGGMAAGLYTVLDYDGRYTPVNGGFRISMAPYGSLLQVLDRPDLKRVDVINLTGMSVNFWNANGLAGPSRYGGGSGTWAAPFLTWSDASGLWHGTMFPQPGFAVFAGDRGDVLVDKTGGAISATGMQFATDGYTLGGDSVDLVGSGAAAPVIRVGDGSGASASFKATVNSVLTGHAGLVKADYGTLILTASNTYSGGTTVSGGTLEVGQDSALGDGSGAIALDGGVLRIDGTGFRSTRRGVTLGATGGGLDIADPANTFTLTQSLSGSGAFVKRGDGSLLMAGMNSYTGGTTISAGTLIGSAAALQGDIVDNGSLVFEQPADGRYTGALSGSGSVTKQGAGMLVFDGRGTFSGHTRVDAGNLQVGSASTPSAYLGGDVSVANGAILSGHGTIGGSIDSYGTVAPGGSVGTLAVQGNAMLEPGSTLYIDTAPDGASRLAVTGSATIAGARLVVDAQGRNWLTNNHYDLLTAGGGVTGQFAAVDSNFAFLNSIVAYSGSGKVSLMLQRNAVSFVDAASSPNQRAVAAAADSLGVGRAVYDRLVTMEVSTARSAFTALAGDLHASAQAVVIDDQRQARDAVSRHLLGADDVSPGAHGDDGHGVTAWTSILGHDANYDGNANAGKIDSSGSGALLGMDVAVDGDARIGVLLGHANQSLHERALDGSAKVHSNQFGLYGDVAFDALTLRGGIVHAHHDIDTTRHVTLGDVTSRLDADRDATSTQGFAELGYAFHPGTRTRLEPFLQVAAVRWSDDSATERGGIGALRVDGRDAHVTVGKLGIHAGMATDATHVVGWQATVAWQHASGDTTPSTRLRFADGGESFDVSGVPLARNATTVDAGLSFRLSPAVHLDASYTGQYASGLSDHGGRVSLGVSF